MFVVTQGYGSGIINPPITQGYGGVSPSSRRQIVLIGYDATSIDLIGDMSLWISGLIGSIGIWTYDQSSITYDQVSLLYDSGGSPAGAWSTPIIGCDATVIGLSGYDSTATALTGDDS